MMNDFAVSQIEQDQREWAERNNCPVCGDPVWDEGPNYTGDAFYSLDDQREVHWVCVGRSLIYSMERLRFQVRHLGMVIAKETGLERLVEWLNRKLS